MTSDNTKDPKDPKDPKVDKDSRDKTKNKPIYDVKTGAWVDPDTKEARPQDEGNGQLSDQERGQVVITNTAAINPAIVKHKKTEGGIL